LNILLLHRLFNLVVMLNYFCGKLYGLCHVVSEIRVGQPFPSPKFGQLHIVESCVATIPTNMLHDFRQISPSKG
jgi:hypothetical protein